MEDLSQLSEGLQLLLHKIRLQGRRGGILREMMEFEVVDDVKLERHAMNYVYYVLLYNPNYKNSTNVTLAKERIFLRS
jgi:hypothetical protein